MTRADIVRNIINDDGYYYTKHSVLEIVNVIFDEHEEEFKQAYIDGSNSNNELIKSLHKQIKLKNAHIEKITKMLEEKR